MFVFLQSFQASHDAAKKINNNNEPKQQHGGREVVGVSLIATLDISAGKRASGSCWVGGRLAFAAGKMR